jgi:hypothetical protein
MQYDMSSRAAWCPKPRGKTVIRRYNAKLLHARIQSKPALSGRQKARARNRKDKRGCPRLEAMGQKKSFLGWKWALFAFTNKKVDELRSYLAKSRGYFELLCKIFG